jgi:hypothetical protein
MQEVFLGGVRITAVNKTEDTSDETAIARRDTHKAKRGWSGNPVR